MASKEKLSHIRIDIADNGAEVCIEYRPEKPPKGDSYVPPREVKEVYQTVAGVQKCVGDHLKEAFTEQRRSKGEKIMAGGEEDDEQPESDEY